MNEATYIDEHFEFPKLIEIIDYELMCDFVKNN